MAVPIRFILRMSLAPLVALIARAAYAQDSRSPILFSDPADAALEFRVKKDYYETRFEDYYVRLLELDRLDVTRQQGVGETRKWRKKIIDDYEQSRREFARNRRAKPELDPALWEKELNQQRKEREADRRDYVKRKSELNTIMQKHNFIPEEEELGLSD